MSRIAGLLSSSQLTVITMQAGSPLPEEIGFTSLISAGIADFLRLASARASPATFEALAPPRWTTVRAF